MPTTPFMGVRISWLMLARNALLARFAASRLIPEQRGLPELFLNRGRLALNASPQGSDPAECGQRDQRGEAKNIKCVFELHQEALRTTLMSRDERSKI